MRRQLLAQLMILGAASGGLLLLASSRDAVSGGLEAPGTAARSAVVRMRTPGPASLARRSSARALALVSSRPRNKLDERAARAKLGQFLDGMREPRQLRRACKALAGHAAYRGWVLDRARQLRASASPLERARGVWYQVAMGQLDADGWMAAYRAESSGEARARMIPVAPRGAKGVVRQLIRSAEEDVDPRVRVAAVRHLPGGLDRQTRRRVLNILRSDPPAEVSRTIARYLLASSVRNRELSQELVALTRDASQPLRTRQLLARSLLKTERWYEGTLARAGGSAEELRRVLGDAPRAR